VIIKSIHLKNIRSYIDEKIEFGKGIILFEGDIGSGKTSILMAMDFALFGNSTKEFYEKLLRKGTQKGSVEILFEHDGKEYRVYRALEKKGRGISNTESYVETPEGKISLGANEIKHYILRLMGVFVEKTKRKSLPIVKYAIYTPQETMKEILEGSSEERLDVIRRIFRLDEYKIARENAENAAKNILAEAKIAEDLERLIEDIEKELDHKENERKLLRERILELEKELFEKKSILENVQKKWVNIQEKRREYEELNNKLTELMARIDGIQSNIKRLRKELEDIKLKRERILGMEEDAKRYEEIERKIKGLRKKREDLYKVEQEIRAARESLKYLNEKIEKGNIRKKELEDLKRKVVLLENKVNKIENMEKKLGDLQKEKSEILGKIKHLNMKLLELEEERKEYANLGAICPKCKRPLTEEHKKKLIMENEKEIEKIKDVIKEVTKSKVDVEKEIKIVESELEQLRDYAKQLAVLKREMENALREVEEGEKAKEKSEEIKKKIESFDVMALKEVEEKIKSLESELENLRELWLEYNTLKREIRREELLKNELNEYENKLRELIKENDEKRKMLESLGYSHKEYEKINEEYIEMSKILRALETEFIEKRAREEELEKEIERKRKDIEDKRKKLEFYRKMEEFGKWLREKFIPALEDIEKMRMIAINEEFKALFENWFHELLGESEYEATVDEEFRPIVRYQKFDMPIGTLSGGERTSVALAYRLALNTMVKRALGLSSNILILDEPTDGFSKDQLYKLKDVFEKMDTDQIIIVSHEKELMNLADKVYHVEKINGVSKIRII